MTTRGAISWFKKTFYKRIDAGPARDTVQRGYDLRDCDAGDGLHLESARREGTE